MIYVKLYMVSQYIIIWTFLIVHLGREIIQGVKQFTGELRTGFGSFIEKNLPPFSSAYPENNCRKKDDNCDQPYSFIHKVYKILKYRCLLLFITFEIHNNVFVSL